ncbi:unnamed protein product [Ilex paraguariensis]|uniref:E3 ubiquitin protein ligase n=1 Tax=Ilex paraguariensis TaxID=185542 RepID=A0ABC8S2F1_9AQUA
MMGSTGEADRKRRHFSSISSTAAATATVTAAKNQPFSPLPDDKKDGLYFVSFLYICSDWTTLSGRFNMISFVGRNLVALMKFTVLNLDTAVLQFQNQKLVQKVKAQKFECVALEKKFSQLGERQQQYDNTLAVVNKSWNELVDDLETCSIRTNYSSCCGKDARHQLITKDGASSLQEDVFLRRLLETGATESTCTSNSVNQMEEDRQAAGEKTKNILCNIVAAIDDLWCLKDGLYASVLKALPEDGSFREKTSRDLEVEVKNLRLAIGDLHLKHKSLAREMQISRDTDAKNKADLICLRGELEDTLAELVENNCKLTTLKAERDAAKGAIFPVLNLVENKPIASDRMKDKEKDLRDMESALKELLDQASSRLVELKRILEERIEILRQLCNLQNTLKNVKCISSSQAYALLKDQLAKAKADVVQYQALFEKLQIEKDTLAWREKEMTIKNDLLDNFHRSSAVADSRITELRIEIQKQINDKNIMETKLEEASRDRGRQEIIAEFKSLVRSFPEQMGSMQSQLSEYKESAADVHSLRAHVRSLSSVLNQKAKDLEALSARSADQIAELQKLQAVVHDLKESDLELKLILEMYRREITDSRDVLEARNCECKAWARVQSLKSSLDEHNLELRVKTAIEAEAMSQQRLAAAEAEIADLRQKLEASKREKSRLSGVMKSKHEENEAYLSEIETIGQAYDDMQTQNQHLLQQITERDDYNIKLVLEGVRARQLQDALRMEKQTMERAIQQAAASVDFFNMKAARIEDQLKMSSDQVQKLVGDGIQSSVTLENFQRKLLDVRKSSEQLRESLEESQSKVNTSRVSLVELQIELEKERFERKRGQEDLEVLRRKDSQLRSHTEGSSIVNKLQQELREYSEILKCSICLDRRKEVTFLFYIDVLPWFADALLTS